MTESTLSLSFTTLRREVGDKLGLNTTVANWSSDETQLVNDIIRQGLTQFYTPPPVNGRVHRWSFLRPVTTLTTVGPYSTGTIAIASGVVTLTSGTFPSWAALGEIQVEGNSYSVNTRDGDTQVTLDDTTVTVSSGAAYTLARPAYTLGDDFGGMDGPITYRPGSASFYPSIEVTSAARIRQFRQNDDTTGRPVFAAIQPQAHVAATGTRFEILLYPIPDDVYVLTYRYKSRPNMIDATSLYPVGGMEHSQTILESCLAIVERKLDDNRGVHHAAFMECLAGSVAHDIAEHTPDRLGYNGDASDALAYEYGFLTTPMVTFEGTQY